MLDACFLHFAKAYTRCRLQCGLAALAGLLILNSEEMYRFVEKTDKQNCRITLKMIIRPKTLYGAHVISQMFLFHQSFLIFVKKTFSKFLYIIS